MLNHLQNIRNEYEFNHLFDQAKINAVNLGLMIPDTTDAQLPRIVRGPARYEMQHVTSLPHVFTEKEKLRSEYYASLDLLISEIERRFDQPGLVHMAALESILTSTTVADEDLRSTIALYDDIDQEKVLREIHMLPDLLQCQHPGTQPVTRPKTVKEWASFFSSQSQTVRHLFRETIKIVQILIVVPATAASAERSLSATSFKDLAEDNNDSEETDTSRTPSLP